MICTANFWQQKFELAKVARLFLLWPENEANMNPENCQPRNAEQPMRTGTLSYTLNCLGDNSVCTLSPQTQANQGFTSTINSPHPHGSLNIRPSMQDLVLKIRCCDVDIHSLLFTF